MLNKKICFMLLVFICLMIHFAYALTFYNYPNPFTEKTTFKIDLGSGAQNLKLNIYDENGYSQWQYNKSGSFSNPELIVWYGKDKNGKQLKAGVYIAKLKVEYETRTEEKIIKVGLIKGY